MVVATASAEQREALQQVAIAAEHRTVEVVQHPGGVEPLGLGPQHPITQLCPVVVGRTQLHVDQHGAGGGT